MGQHHELSLHVKGALRNGVTREEIRAVLLQTVVYCGAPAALAAFLHDCRPLDCDCGVSAALRIKLCRWLII
ncbi:gamma carboxymuconolactone decarboxylase [Yersinia pseudotuberculosis]|nr:gamma carboxymuconolactone decarboxylase [Yersinia pseudotuberculosis]